LVTAGPCSSSAATTAASSVRRSAGTRSVGRAARSQHHPSRRTALWTRAFRPSLTPGSTEGLRWQASWIRRLTWLAAWMTSTAANRRLSRRGVLERIAPALQAGSRESESDRFSRALAHYRQVVDQCKLQAPEPAGQVRAPWWRRR
jgi:hypothetical protein